MRCSVPFHPACTAETICVLSSHRSTGMQSAVFTHTHTSVRLVDSASTPSVRMACSNGDNDRKASSIITVRVPCTWWLGMYKAGVCTETPPSLVVEKAVMCEGVLYVNIMLLCMLCEKRRIFLSSFICHSSYSKSSRSSMSSSSRYSMSSSSTVASSSQPSSSSSWMASM